MDMSGTQQSAKMIVVTDPRCKLHNPPHEIVFGTIVPYLESPERLTRISTWLRDFSEPGVVFSFEDTAEEFGLEPVLKVHEKHYVEYLEGAYEAWCRDGGSRDGVFPETFPVSSLGIVAMPPDSDLPPIAKAGLYCFDLSCPITKATFGSIYASVQVALTAASRLHYLTLDVPSSTVTALHGVFALTRPPGHHSGPAVCGGYCFLNNAAIATRWLQEQRGGEKAAILDMFDQRSQSGFGVHHGNGTQQIFYNDPSVLYVSLHAKNEYPYYTGSSAERGGPAALGSNHNFALKTGTGDEEYLAALGEAAEVLKGFGAGFLVVSLGVDTFSEDPICNFCLTTPVYRKIGQAIAQIGLPTLFIMEGGYAMDALGANVGGVLVGFEASRNEA